MFSVSSRFLSALRYSHTAISRVDLVRQGEVLVSDVPVLAGEVQCDVGALIRRRATLNLAPVHDLLDLIGTTPPVGGGLWPIGNELRLYGGIRYVDGAEELAPMGVFRINRPKVDHSGDEVSLVVEGMDRGRAVSRAAFTVPYEIAEGTNYATAIKDLIKSRIPWLADDQYDFMVTSYVTPDLVFLPDDDPWVVAQQMAQSLGAELLFNGEGKCVLRPEPDPAFTPPSFVYAEGEDATLISTVRDLDDEQAHNGVIVVSENTDLATPLRSEVWDTDPASPTYYDPNNPQDSIYGAVPMFINSQYITTQAQCDAAAQAQMARMSGIIEKIDFTAINNPAHEEGDVISVQDLHLGVDNVYILETLRIGLGEAFVMSGTTRKRRAA